MGPGGYREAVREASTSFYQIKLFHAPDLGSTQLAFQPGIAKVRFEVAHNYIDQFACAIENLGNFLQLGRLQPHETRGKQPGGVG